MRDNKRDFFVWGEKKGVSKGEIGASVEDRISFRARDIGT